MKKEAGSLSIETAISLSFTLIVCLALMHLTYLIRTDLSLKHSLDQVASELSFSLSLAEGLSESLDPEMAAQLRSLLLKEDSSQLVSDLASSYALAPIINRRLNFYLGHEARVKDYLIKSMRRKLSLSWQKEARLLILQMDYEQNTYFGKVKKRIFSFVPLWFLDIDDLGEANEANAGSSIWQKDNFTRGRYFRQKYQANLPFNYPVIARFKSGKALAIRSIDLNKPSYQDREKLKKEIKKEVDRLANFAGSSRAINSAGSQIRAGDIKSKKLMIVHPQDLDLADFALIKASLKSYASSRSVSLVFTAFGKSKVD